MRVILTQHATDHRRTLAKLGVGKQPLVVIHRVQDATLNWLQPSRTSGSARDVMTDKACLNTASASLHRVRRGS